MDTICLSNMKGMTNVRRICIMGPALRIPPPPSRRDKRQCVFV